jgi:putative transposase
VFVYTAFAIDAFAGRIVGRQCSASKQTAFVESAIRQAAATRARDGNPLTGNAIHHSDAGSQHTSVRFGQTLMLAGMKPSIRPVGDAFDNALAETTIGLSMTEAVRKDSPFRYGPLHRLANVELLTADWVRWCNIQPPHAPPRPCTPCGIRDELLRSRRSRQDGGTPVTKCARNPGCFKQPHQELT